jgi:hypothetical protein
MSPPVLIANLYGEATKFRSMMQDNQRDSNNINDLFRRSGIFISERGKMVILMKLFYLEVLNGE